MFYMIVVFCLSVSSPGECLVEKDVQFNPDTVSGCASRGELEDNEKILEWLNNHPDYAFHGWKCSSRPMKVEHDI